MTNPEFRPGDTPDPTLYQFTLGRTGLRMIEVTNSLKLQALEQNLHRFPTEMSDFLAQQVIGNVTVKTRDELVDVLGPITEQTYPYIVGAHTDIVVDARPVSVKICGSHDHK